jgi:TM2 domain-containing membrane protein YozV
VEYYILQDDKQTGPYTVKQLRSMWNAGQLTAETFYWREGMSEWTPLRGVIDKLEHPLPQPMSQTGPVIVTTRKSRGVYIILGIFFGLLGVHNFYAGYYAQGAAQCLSTILLCWTVVVPIIVLIWVIVDLCTVTHDASGYQMS